MKKTLIIATLGIAAMCAKADSTISYTNAISSTLTDWSQNLALTKFNTSLGTLDSVEIYLNTSFATTLNVTNTGSSASSGTASTVFTITVNPSALGTTETALFGGSPTMSFNSQAYSYSLSAGAGTSTGVLGIDTTSTRSYTPYYTADSGLITSGSVFTDLQGTGVVDLLSTTHTTTDTVNSGGNTSSSQVTDAGLTAVVVYDYTAAPTPEPSTVAMIGTGLAGLGFMFRRRSSK